MVATLTWTRTWASRNNMKHINYVSCEILEKFYMGSVSTFVAEAKGNPLVKLSMFVGTPLVSLIVFISSLITISLSRRSSRFFDIPDLLDFGSIRQDALEVLPVFHMHS